MKAIMISIKPKWCAKIMNGEKTIEVRKNKTLANAIKKLIAENGYADIYVYCSKGKQGIFKEKYNGYVLLNQNKWIHSELNGKVLFKFRCYKVEEIKFHILTKTNTYGVQRIETTFTTQTLSFRELKKLSCLTCDNLMKYLNDTDGYAIHISNLEIFDEPKELSEFYTTNLDKDIIKLFDNSIQLKNGTWVKPLTKAPQNFCYVEEEK